MAAYPGSSEGMANMNANETLFSPGMTKKKVKRYIYI